MPLDQKFSLVGVIVDIFSSGMATEARHDGHSNEDDGDFEDLRPLSSIISRNSPLDRPSKIVKDESDDEAPISSRFKRKNGNGISGSKQDSTGEKKPLVNKLQNGSKVSGKRLLEKGCSADQSSMKKHKVSSSSTSVAMEQDSLKIEKKGDKRKVVVSPRQLSVKEDETDDDDDVPIAKRIKSDSLNYKTPSAKPKVLKQSSNSSATKSKVRRIVCPRSKTRSKKSKKVMKDSKYAKTAKSLPCGDGKKKWTTLVHNGVTFPPSYQPHGTKILYKGKPVNLSPEQEEVTLSIHALNIFSRYQECFLLLLVLKIFQGSSFVYADHLLLFTCRLQRCLL